MANEPPKKGLAAIEGLVAGFSRLFERLQEVSQEAGQRASGGTFQRGGKPMNGVFGLSFKVGTLGDKEELKVEPFGNVRSDQSTGEPLVEELREPLVDVFDEGDLLIVAEMPGIDAEDVTVALDGTRLTIRAERGERKYHKQLEVPAGLRSDAIEIQGRNGIVELKLHRG